ncbi:unnamed protein product [Paramecium sonneborni]|uniref:Uncharacterized protein n=1 Tax=Paramecium sonneborni TaxID=65129 RepID=A0A8S1QRA6_9CILI|nr:unnamed protein product [Paramecium sonneborni]
MEFLSQEFQITQKYIFELQAKISQQIRKSNIRNRLSKIRYDHRRQIIILFLQLKIESGLKNFRIEDVYDIVIMNQKNLLKINKNQMIKNFMSEQGCNQIYVQPQKECLI